MGIFGITRAPAARSFLDNPNVPITMEQLALLTNYGPTRSGIQVSEQTALTFTAVFTAVRVISEAIGCMSLNVYREQGEGGKKQLATGLPAHRLLSRKANPEMTAATFKETLMVNLLLWGAAYARIEFDNANRPRALWPLLSRITHPERIGGNLKFVVEGGGTFDAEEILHIPGLSINGLACLSPIAYAREAIALGKAAELYGASFFGNGGTLQGAITVEGELSDKAYARLMESFNHRHQGVANAHKTAIFEGNSKYQAIGIPPDQAQFLATRKFQVAEVARIYRVPLHKMGDLEKSAFSNIEQQSLDFRTETLGTYTQKIEEECDDKLLNVNDGTYCAFDDRRFLRGDIKTRMAFYASALQNGYMNRDEVRAELDMDPIPGGDAYLVQLNMGNAGGNPDDSNNKTPLKTGEDNENDSEQKGNDNAD